MKRSIYAVISLIMMVMAVGFTACGDDDKGFSAEQIAYLGKEGEETQCPTSQTPVTMILKGDFISGQNFQKEMTMTLTPAGVVPGLGSRLKVIC